MAVRVLPAGALKRRSRQILALHQEWAGRQIAAGVDGATPAGRPVGSDYSQHVPDVEASGLALDDYFDRLDQILATTAN